MIFMQQKHFNNPRIFNHRIRTNRHPNRQQRNSNQPALSLPSEHHVLNITDDLNENETSENSPRPFKLNEKITSVGGLFGTMSIIITGALLYAIFTAKAQDKWYYISAVLINISLLLLLMVGAILFDKYYLKKYPTPSPSMNTNRHLVNASNRIINVNAVLYPVSNPYIQNSLITADSVNSIDHVNSQNYRFRNDVPPQYPDLTSVTFINLNKTDKETNADYVRRNHANTDNIGIQASDIKTQVKQDSPINQPPNYFDLYPSNKTVTETNERTNESQATSSILHI